MAVMVLFEAQVKPAAIDELKATMKKLLPETRTCEGCKGIDVYFDLDDGTGVVFHERWESREHHRKYLAWRTETGVMEKLGAALSAPPRIRYFEHLDA